MGHGQKTFLTPWTRTHFVALQRCLVPRAKLLTSDQERRSEDLVNSVLSDKPFLIHFKIRLFFFVIDVVSFFLGLRPFRFLSEDKQTRVMTFFFDSPIALFRKGFWGVNTLAKMGVYGQNFFHADIGYKLREVPR
jgi:hypothetical protein